MNRYIYEGRKRWLFRLPKEAVRKGESGWCLLDKSKWTLDKTSLHGVFLSPSVVIDFGKGKRHFFVRNDEVCFCADDPVCASQNFLLPALPRFWIAGMVDLLPPALQPGRAVAEPSEDY